MDGDLFENTGEGDDALDRYVARMATIEQVTPLGSTVSYNNASLAVAGKALEHITGKIYEDVIRELVFEPLGMDRSYYFAKEIMTYRFAQGQAERGRLDRGHEAVGVGTLREPDGRRGVDRRSIS